MCPKGRLEDKKSKTDVSYTVRSFILSVLVCRKFDFRDAFDIFGVKY